MFRPAVIEAMTQHAERCYPQESCGLVAWGDYIPRPNVHEQPEQHFKIEDRHILPLLKHGQIQAVVHSHPAPAAPAYPSLGDMRQQIAMDVPWCIVPVAENGQAGAPFWWGDGTPTPPLIGRGYRWGVTDCYAILRDYFRAVGLSLPAVAREYGYWTRTDAEDLYLQKYYQAGFTCVSNEQAGEVGDVLLYCVNRRHRTHHAAVVAEPGKILHHPAQQAVDASSLSRRDLLSRYQQYITHVLRPTDAVPRA